MSCHWLRGKQNEIIKERLNEQEDVRKSWDHTSDKGRRKAIKDERRRVIYSEKAAACSQPNYSFILEEECCCCKGLMHSLCCQGHLFLHILQPPSFDKLSKMQECVTTDCVLYCWGEKHLNAGKVKEQLNSDKSMMGFVQLSTFPGTGRMLLLSPNLETRQRTAGLTGQLTWWHHRPLSDMWLHSRG